MLTFLFLDRPSSSNGIGATGQKVLRMGVAWQKFATILPASVQNIDFRDFLKLQLTFIFDFRGGYYSTFCRKIDGLAKNADFWSKFWKNAKKRVKNQFFPNNVKNIIFRFFLITCLRKLLELRRFKKIHQNRTNGLDFRGCRSWKN